MLLLPDGVNLIIKLCFLINLLALIVENAKEPFQHSIILIFPFA